MKVLIADGSPTVRERLTALMLEIPTLELLAPTATGEATLESVRAHDPDVLVIDARILSGKGRKFVETVRKEKPAIVLIILSNFVYPQYQKYYEAAGADLLMDKSSDFIHLYQFIRELVRSPQSEAVRTSKDSIRKRMARTKLRVGLQLSLFVFTASSLFVGLWARCAVPWLAPAGGKVCPYAQNLPIGRPHVERQSDDVINHHMGGRIALPQAGAIRLAQGFADLLEREKLSDNTQADVIGNAAPGRQSSDGTGHSGRPPAPTGIAQKHLSKQYWT
jgi:CheY-like chemotaxis protein